MAVLTVSLASFFLAMEPITTLALVALQFLLRAFVITAFVFLGPCVLGKPIRARFGSMFRVTCVILLILNVLASMGRPE
jgi:hypothetical protein